MNYKKIEIGSYNLHMIKTNKFKTTNLEIVFSNKIKKEEITLTNFLSASLFTTSKKYNTKMLQSRKLEDLYAARFSTNCYRIGNLFNVDFNMKILNDKYVEENLLEKALDFLHEVLFNPNVKDNRFDEDTFNIVYNEQKAQIDRLKEDTKRYSLQRMLELTDEDAPYSYNLKGNCEDLNKITRGNLYSFYKKMIKCTHIDIFVIGDIDFESVKNIIANKFDFKVKREDNISPLVPLKKIRNKIQEVSEDDATNQAKLSMSLLIEDMTKFERDYVVNIYNSILGGTADSLLFKNVREKFSLCYYITSGAYKVDNLLTIVSGFTKDNYKQVLFLIDKELNNIIEGKFDDESIDNAKNYYISSLEAIEDSPTQIIASFYAMDLLGVDSIEKRKENIKKVTKEDIINLAKKVHKDTIFLLGGNKK